MSGAYKTVRTVRQANKLPRGAVIYPLDWKPAITKWGETSWYSPVASDEPTDEILDYLPAVVLHVPVDSRKVGRYMISWTINSPHGKAIDCVEADGLEKLPTVLLRKFESLVGEPETGERLRCEVIKGGLEDSFGYFFIKGGTVFEGSWREWSE